MMLVPLIPEKVVALLNSNYSEENIKVLAEMT
jgi:hypothetical protein